MKRDRRGFTLVEIMFVAFTIGLLATLAVPAFVKAREPTRRSICVNNLRQLEGAKQQWAVESFATGTAIPATADLDPYIKRTTAAMTCPSDSAKTFATSYTINNVDTPAECKNNPATHIQ